MQLPGSRGQQIRDFMYDASGTTGTGATLILPEQPNRTALFLQNISATAMYIEIGGARATATLTSGSVTSIAMTNTGFGYTIPPRVKFFGGGNLAANPTYIGPGLPGLVGPSTSASGHALLTAGAVSSIVIDNGGANYKEAPYVFLQSSEQDPYGAATPSTTSGFELYANTLPLIFGFQNTVCPTDAISVYAASSNLNFTCKYMIGG